MAVTQKGFDDYIERLKKAGKYDEEAKKKVGAYAKDKGLNVSDGGDSGSKQQSNNDSGRTQASHNKPNDYNKPSKSTVSDGGSNNISNSNNDDLKSAVSGGVKPPQTNKNIPEKTTDMLNNPGEKETVQPNKNIPNSTSDVLSSYSGNKNNQPTTTSADDAYQKKNTEGMTDEEKKEIRELGIRWKQADTALKRNQISPEKAEEVKREVHQKAEAIRSKYGFSGGQDGTETNDLSSDKITTGGEGELNGEANINPETGEMVYTGENQDMVNMLMKELEKAKDSQEFYEKAMQELINQDDSANQVEVLSYEEALEQARDRLDPLYDNAREEYTEKLDADAVRRGMFNQLPQEAFKRETIGKLENERVAEISNLASNLESKSKQEASQMASVKQQEMQNKLNVLMAGLQASGNASQMSINTLNTIASLQMQKEQMNTNNEFTERELDLKENAQDFNQAVTLAELDMKKQQIEQDEVYNNARIAQSWENISNDRARLAQASEELGLRRRGLELDEDAFKVGLAEKAWELTERELISNDPSIEFDEQYYAQLEAQDEDINYSNDLMPEDEGYSNLSGQYLEEIRNQSNEVYDTETIQDTYRQMLDSLNAQISTFDEYQD